MSNTPTQDDSEIDLINIISKKSEYWFMIETKTHNWVVDENSMLRDLIPFIKAYGDKRELEGRVKGLQDYAKRCGILRVEPTTRALQLYIQQVKASLNKNGDD